MRLKSHITASALLRRAQSEGLFAVVLHKGHPEGGLIHVKIRDGDEACLWTERYEGGFTPSAEGFQPEAEVDERARRNREFDRDLWLIEIEGRAAEDLLKD